MQKLTFALLAVTLGLLSLATMSEVAFGLYVELDEGQNKCFIEEVPKDTLVLASFDTEQIVVPGTPADPRFLELGIKVSTRDPEGNILVQKTLPASSRFAFTSRVGGEHVVCFQTNTSRWFGAGMKLKFTLSLESGAAAVDYDEIAKVEHLNTIEVQVRRLNDRVRSIRKEQTYQRTREEQHRDTSESTNSRVMWWSLIQTTLLTLSGVWQVFHLKSFLNRRGFR
jgi:p24 family protein alpha